MKKCTIRKITAAILTPILLMAVPAPTAFAAEKSILSGDADIEALVREVQAQTLFFAAPTLADMNANEAVIRAREKWEGNNKWAFRYVLYHGVLAQTNRAFDGYVDVNSQPDSFPNKEKFANQFFEQMFSGLQQIAPMLNSFEKVNELSHDEKEMAEILSLATRGRIFCYMSMFSNTPENYTGIGAEAYREAISVLRETGPQNIVNIVQGMELAEFDGGNEDAFAKPGIVKKLENQRDLICGA
jgi:hypothetical protein